MKEFTIDKSHWLRGGNDGAGNSASSTLCNSDDHKCCLGHFATYLGFTREQIFNKPAPVYTHPISNIKGGLPASENWPRASIEWPKELLTVTDWGAVMDTEVCEDIIRTNDKDKSVISDEERQTKLIELFESIGYRPIFV
jgi:hypothetical protein